MDLLKNKPSKMKDSFARILSENISLSMSDCDRYGMTWGCDIDCPQLQRGECPVKDDENKDLYQKYLKTKKDESST